ncbi:MAG: PAS domain S-box protein [Myxococcota bacterium]
MRARLDTDITSRFLREIAERSPNMVFVNQGGSIIYANATCTRILGYTQEELVAPEFDFLSLIAPESSAIVGEMYQRHQRGEHVVPYEYVLLTKHGVRIEAINATHLIDVGGAPAILGIVTDIRANKENERQLRDSEERYRTLVEMSPDAVLVTDIHGRITTANRRLAELLGAEDEQALLQACPDAWDLLAPEERPVVRESLPRLVKHRRFDGLTRVMRRLDGSRFVAEVSGALLPRPMSGEHRLLMVLRDTTERQRAEAQRRALEQGVQHAQKLESLGLLAGGIAHDFNNLLTAIQGNCDLARMHLPDDSTGRRFIEQAAIASRRAADLTRALLAYSGRATFVVDSVDVGYLVRELGELLNVSVPKNVVLRMLLGGEVPTVRAERSQLQQLVLNLLTNAAEAMGERQGHVTVRTFLVADGSRERCVASFFEGSLTARPYVVLEVEDAGVGIAPEILGKMFDPFFSTKGTGRGLGLSLVLGIVRGHQGAISVGSTPGVGTVVRVFLPAEQAARPTTGDEVVSGKARGPARIAGAVLIVDDEEPVRRVAASMLEMGGMRTLIACDGVQMLEVLRQTTEPVAAVLLDLTMPKLGGKDALRELRRTHPTLPVLLCSGYDELDAMEGVAGDRYCAFVQKPFLTHELLDKLRLVLLRAPDNT